MIKLICVIVILCGASASTTQPVTLVKMSDGEIIDLIDKATAAHDLAAMKRLSALITADFRANNVSRYGKLMLRVCDELGSYDFKNPQQYSMASDLAQQASELSDSLPVNQAVGFADRLRFGSGGNSPAARERFVADRKLHAETWMRAYCRLTDLRDKPYDESYKPVRDESPPGFEDIMAGSDPVTIKDPGRRAAYIKALEGISQKAKGLRDHTEALDLLSRYRPDFIAYIGRVFALEPADETSLKALMNDHKISANDQSDILSIYGACIKPRATSAHK